MTISSIRSRYAKRTRASCDPILGQGAAIYLLIDPRTDEIRYVGKTTQVIESRITAHLRDASPCHRVHWLNELKREGLRPKYVIVAECHGDWPWQNEERGWIRMLKHLGARLVNDTSGGDGVADLPPETREKMRRIWLGRKHTPETLAKLRAARARRVTTEETRAKMSASQKGRRITWGEAISEATRKLGADEAAQIKFRLECGEKVCDLAKEFGMHRTSISKIKMGTYFV